jgi:hypothetical protein
MKKGLQSNGKQEKARRAGKETEGRAKCGWGVPTARAGLAKTEKS